MRVLVAGDWHSDLHETEVCKSLRRLGHEALEFKWHHYFTFDSQKPRTFNALLKRIQNKFVTGPSIARINSDFLKQIRVHRPEMIFVYRGTHLTAATLMQVKQELPTCKLVGYNNDDPFSPTQPRYLWRHFMAAIPAYDLMLAYRHANLDDFRRLGAKNVQLLRSWFVPDRNFPIDAADESIKRYQCDVVFVGHYESDSRLSCFEAIVEAGIDFKIYGPGYDWDPVIQSSKSLEVYKPVKLVWNIEYNKVLNGAQIALCFLSKLNRDTYTRRCFEIPATKTLLMSEYTDDLAALFVEDMEIVFFRSKEELVSKIKYYLGNPELLEKISTAGYLKVLNAGHDIDSRIKMVMEMKD